ncbi:SMP-30/gluconolactonase/LRE family protein [Microbacterium sp. SSW1-49]|uniref:SMP-30/gluconolactonase/LRE family protein n=1 Tax=Microbacterium croceum TaxID=2851645 RepID=A0ABT0FBN3_9MICO|nr:SMP-30/gluconolactonase/LRE family protein [Microbacterium croceum]MCK2035469.1 SMP-30/gluconolactonase/LRE family protein [Microbacterium croceum]
MISADQVTGPLCAHGEGPVWDNRDGSLRWVDMVEGVVLRLDPVDDKPTAVRIGPWVAALRPRVDGGWVIATRSGFLLADADLRPEQEIRAFDDPRLRMNDGACAPDGSFLCGTAGAAGSGFLYRLDPAGTVGVIAAGISISNGLVADPLGDGVFYVDTATRRIDRLRLADGAVREREPYVDLGAFDGLPDGITADAEGGVWVAMWGAGTVIRIGPDGRQDARIRLPTPHVSACAFGGPHLDDLYITTSQQDLRRRDAAAGALFRAQPGVRGVSTLAFAG